MKRSAQKKQIYTKGQIAGVVGVVVLALGFLSYRTFFTDGPVRTEEAESAVPANLRPYNAVIRYPVPGKDHVIDFGILIDEAGLIQEFKFTDVTDPEHQVKVDEFSATLLERVKGRELRSLEAVDMVGTSSLTTNAFNDALAKIQAQL